MFVHVVLFYLKKGLSPEEVVQFETGVSSLGTIDGLINFNIGKPADTDRPIIDKSYDYCELTVFADQATHDVYQEAEIHLKFIRECSHLWERVVIFDSVSI
ncbi:MAG: Dabb family protein [Cytophagaceae bacterium]|nr:Dabb family protein [Cytophagaceae bacterium]